LCFDNKSINKEKGVIKVATGIDAEIVFLQTIADGAYNIVMGWPGTIITTYLIIYFGSWVHNKLPHKHHLVGTFLIFVFTIFGIISIIVWQGDGLLVQLAAIAGLTFGVYHMEKVPLKIIMDTFSRKEG